MYYLVQSILFQQKLLFNQIESIYMAYQKVGCFSVSLTITTNLLSDGFLLSTVFCP